MGAEASGHVLEHDHGFRLGYRIERQVLRDDCNPAWREAQIRVQRTRDRPQHETRSAEVRALVRDVLADADTRANLMQSGMTAGYADRRNTLAVA